MKKRKLALSALGLVAVAALASCGDETTNNAGGNNSEATGTISEEIDFEMSEFAPVQNAGRLDVIAGYNQTEGSISPLKDWTDPITEEKYTTGSGTNRKILKAWENLAAATGAEVVDANNYSKKITEIQGDISTGGYKSYNDPEQKVDLLSVGIGNANKATGDFVELDNYFEYMPNFKAFLDKNPLIRQQLTFGGHIYYTPYFDGYNAYERSVVMDTNIAYKILDKKDFNNPVTDESGKVLAQPATATVVTQEYDTTTKNGGTTPDSNVIQGAKYKPFMGDYNLPDDQLTQPVLVYVDGVATKKDVTFNKVENIIKQQNALLSREGGCTGKELAEQLVKYVQDVTAGTNLYENLADYYVGESAAYTVDDLIAIMRVVKANPGYLTGDASQEVEALFPRQTDNTGRIWNMMGFAQVWGVQGLTAESEALYYDADGHLNDAYSTRATYDALEYMSQLYDEGLIDSQFYNSSSNANRSNAFFAHTVSGVNTVGFIEWDYTATQSNQNTMVDGVGVADSKRGGKSQTGVKCILSPLSYWSTTNAEATFYQPLADHSNKTILRYDEENRALKDTSWCIPTTADNITGACVFMDYLFSKHGQNLFDFVGPEYWTGAEDSFEYNGSKTPEFNAAFFDWFQKNPSNSSDFWKYIRLNYGASLGIGYVRTTSINYQATNYYAKDATKHMEDAIRVGVQNLAQVKSVKTTESGATWSTSAPLQGYITSDPETYSAVPAFWSTVKGTTAYHWYKYICDPAGTYTYTMDPSTHVMSTANTTTMGADKNAGGANYTFKMVIDQIEARKTDYLQSIIDSEGFSVYSPFYLD